MFNNFILVDLLDISGNLKVNVRKALEQKMKAQNFLSYVVWLFSGTNISKWHQADW